MKQAMVFAAGLGTRLKPLTDTMPKALVPVAGKPLLEHVITQLQDAGFERIVVNIHHFGQQIIDFLDAHGRFGLDIRISDERDQLLETGGGIKKARPLFDPHSPILIHNVDILSNADLGEGLFEPMKSHRPQDVYATLLVSARTTSRYLLFSPTSHRLIGWKNTKTGELKGPIAKMNSDDKGAAIRSLNGEGSTGPEEERHDDNALRNEEMALMKRTVEESMALAFSGIHVLSPTLFPLMDAWPDKFSIIDFYLGICNDYPIIGCPDSRLRLMDVGKLDTLAAADAFVTQLRSQTL
ncbi:MAG: nucleotidyltransferase family protein [Bacteroidales bacterium]|nr:nucleotidyltransferase family protein [Bacteroidales bacterium]